MKAMLREFYSIGLQTYSSWRQDRTLRLGAGLAYYALFAFVPLLALTAALSEWLFGIVDMEDYLTERLAQIGIVDADNAGAAITDELTGRSVQTSLGIIGLGSLLFASSLVFLALTDAINAIWGAPVGSGVWRSIRRRLVAFLMVLGTGAVLIMGFAVSAVTGAAEAMIPGDEELVVGFADLLAGLASWVSLAGAIVLLFRYLPPSSVPWRAAIPAGILTAILLVVGTVAVGWYLTSFGGSSVPGAVGAMFAVLTWVYYEAQILLGGAQLTNVLAATDGGDHDAVDESRLA